MATVMTPRKGWMKAVGIGSRDGKVRKWRVDSGSKSENERKNA